MREQFVASGVAFLAHPSVADTSLTDRENFLRSKGLTNDEIVEAVRRVAASNPSALVQQASAPSPPSPTAPSTTQLQQYTGHGGVPVEAESPSMLSTVMQWLVAAGVGAGLYRSFGGVLREAITGVPEPLPVAPPAVDPAAANAAAELEASNRWVTLGRCVSSTAGGECVSWPTQLVALA